MLTIASSQLNTHVDFIVRFQLVRLGMCPHTSLIGFFSVLWYTISLALSEGSWDILSNVLEQLNNVIYEDTCPSLFLCNIIWICCIYTHLISLCSSPASRKIFFLKRRSHVRAPTIKSILIEPHFFPYIILSSYRERRENGRTNQSSARSMATTNIWPLVRWGLNKPRW